MPKYRLKIRKHRRGWKARIYKQHPDRGPITVWIAKGYPSQVSALEEGMDMLHEYYMGTN